MPGATSLGSSAAIPGGSMTEIEHGHEDPHGAPVSRRTVMKWGWAAPAIMVAAPRPAFAASPPQNIFLNANIGIYPNNVQGNPRMSSFPQGFDPADEHYIEVTITDARPGRASRSTASAPIPPTNLRTWLVMSLSATQVVLRWPNPMTGTGLNTGTFLWYWQGTATRNKIRVTGAITGTDVTFAEGVLVGPTFLVGIIDDPA